MSSFPDKKAIAKVDSAGLLGDMLAMPEHLRDGLWRAQSARLPELNTLGGMLVCGMGGSAVGGDLLAAAYGDRLLRPLHVVRNYGLPSWATGDMTVLCSSYSGETEETLACFEAAGAVGAPRVVATTGGSLAEMAREEGVSVIGLPSALQPRAAVAYMFVAAVEVAARAEAGPGLRSEIDEVAGHLESLLEQWGPESNSKTNLAMDLADAASDAEIFAVFGADLTAGAALRIKTQINENAKMMAAHAELPEADHNEIVGWANDGRPGKRFALFLEDSDQHPRIRQRIEVTERVLADHGALTRRVRSLGESRSERLFSLVLLGDLLSVYLAVIRGVDPTPVSVIDEVKAGL